MEHLTSLTDLALGYGTIVDVGAFAYLVNLKNLDLQSNQVADVSPLATLTNLETLYLGSNAVVDVTPLAGLTNLTTLDLGANSITTGVAALVTLAKANEINLNSNSGISCSELQTLIDALGTAVVSPNSPSSGVNCVDP
jgi:internalin A